MTEEASVQNIEIGMADMRISSSPDVLITRGLGSCLGITLYDPIKKMGGLVHPMLPQIAEGRVKSNPYKFVDSAIDAMIDELHAKGCKTFSLIAKVFGGGHMFSSIPASSVFNIGARNAEIVKKKFADSKIKIAVEDVGGNYGRTLFFNLETGTVRVKTLFHGEREV
ncbi:MAG: chemotaxis protein CheD [Candidatus Omnitrophica bacterium]|nr:chemotaxis protein CheD [Candidatus Omnitrophota bacterium]